MAQPATVPEIDRSNVAECSRCHAQVYFVEGVRGPERWRHVQTDDWVCDPRCQKCGQPGVFQIGRYDMDSGQRPEFRFDHWECGDCARGQLRIEHT